MNLSLKHLKTLNTLGILTLNPVAKLTGLLSVSFAAAMSSSTFGRGLKFRKSCLAVQGFGLQV